jgi:hypothetical protein
VDRALRWDESKLLAHRPRLHTRRALFELITCPMDLRIHFLGKLTRLFMERDPSDHLNHPVFIGHECKGWMDVVGL